MLPNVELSSAFAPDLFANIFLAVFILSFATLILWRFWAFTLWPYFYPEEPKELPYWIPFFGHLRSFFKDYNGTLEEGRKYFKDTKEPYSVFIAGKRIYIATAPQDVANLYRNTTTISYHNIIQDMHTLIGFSQDGIDKMFTLDPDAKHNAGLSRPMPAAFMVNEYHRMQVQPGKRCDEFLHNKILPKLTNDLDFDNLRQSSQVIEKSSDGLTISLLDLVAQSFIQSMTEAFFGKTIWKVNPHLSEAFMVWERTNWKYLFRMPEFISGDMLAARNEMINTFIEYFRLPIEERQDSNFFIQSVEAMIRDVGLSEPDMARVFLLHYWAVLGNMYKVTFWSIVHVLYNPELRDSLLEECRPAMKDGQLDEYYLAEKCVKLDSLVGEALRLSVASALLRDIVKPTVVGGKVLRPGNKVLVPYRQLHLNRDVWGQDPYAMDAERFSNDPKLYNSKSYRPFGGGSTLCPGRFIAKRSIGYSIALLFTRYDVTIDTKRTKTNGVKSSKDGLPRFPGMDTTKPTPGASLPCKGEDVVIHMKRKM